MGKSRNQSQQLEARNQKSEIRNQNPDPERQKRREKGKKSLKTKACTLVPTYGQITRDV